MSTNSPSKASVDQAQNNDMTVNEERTSSTSTTPGGAATVDTANNEVHALQADLIRKRNATSSFRKDSSFSSQLVSVALGATPLSSDDKTLLAKRVSMATTNDVTASLPGAYDSSETNFRFSSLLSSSNQKPSQSQLMELVQLQARQKELTPHIDRGLEECRADTTGPMDDLQERMNEFNARVTAQNTEQDDVQSIQREEKKRKRFLILTAAGLVGVLAIIGTIVGIVVGRSGKGSSSETSDNPIDANPWTFDYLFSNPCANASSNSQAMTERYLQLRATIGTRFPTTMAVGIDTPLTKQRLALCWVSDLDQWHQLNFIVMTEEEAEDVTIQRFLLAIVYFHFIAESDSMGASSAGLMSDSNWLSSTMQDCDWDYVVCDKATNRRVERLELKGLKLGGQIPSELALLTNIMSLDLSVNDLSGSIPSKLGSMTQLTRLALHTNQLSGAIFEDITSLEKLNELHIAHNLFTGTMPAIWNMTKMTVLSMGYNGFEGTLSDLSASTKLGLLDFSDLALSGTIPVGFWALTHLSLLRMVEASLSGTISTEIGQLRQLSVLNLLGGSFSGTIPSEMGRLNNLRLADLRNNRFTGTIPKELCFLLNNSLSLIIKVDSQTACGCYFK